MDEELRKTREELEKKKEEEVSKTKLTVEFLTIELHVNLTLNFDL